MEVRICSTCKRELPLTKEYYPIKNRMENYFDTWCRKCHAEYNKLYREKNKETLVKYDKKYYQDNKESISVRHKGYKKNKVYIQDKIKEAARKRIWCRNNVDKMRRHGQRRRSAKKDLPATLTLLQWNLIKKHFNYKCAYCGKSLLLQQDHFVPLTKGGEYSHNNIIPACGPCNYSKNNKSFFDWYPYYKDYSKKREKDILEFLCYNSTRYQQLKFAETVGLIETDKSSVSFG